LDNNPNKKSRSELVVETVEGDLFLFWRFCFSFFLLLDSMASASAAMAVAAAAAPGADATNV